MNYNMIIESRSDFKNIQKKCLVAEVDGCVSRKRMDFKSITLKKMFILLLLINIIHEFKAQCGISDKDSIDNVDSMSFGGKYFNRVLFEIKHKDSLSILKKNLAEFRSIYKLLDEKLICTSPNCIKGELDTNTYSNIQKKFSKIFPNSEIKLFYYYTGSFTQSFVIRIYRNNQMKFTFLCNPMDQTIRLYSFPSKNLILAESYPLFEELSGFRRFSIYYRNYLTFSNLYYNCACKPYYIYMFNLQINKVVEGYPSSLTIAFENKIFDGENQVVNLDLFEEHDNIRISVLSNRNLNLISRK